ncbi:MAG: iron-containing alcohol dehydrogenase, partial [Bacteroidetes bacterium]|nr:iron-containing alcohol dehydrogenase [Bacteroidota bacterium]
MKILYSNLVRNIEKIVGKYRDDGIFVVIDSTVYDIFIDIIESLRSTGIRSVYKMVAVESTKSIDEAVSLWQWLGNEGANRQSLIVNIGGGITTDLGGFVAATFKRGCDFVNIPTTLMAMVDASIGGKTGINFAGLKNEVGVFADPKWILIDTDLIDTLPYTAKADGYAEMLKYGLISDSDLLRQTYDIDLENIDKKLLSNL